MVYWVYIQEDEILFEYKLFSQECPDGLITGQFIFPGRLMVGRLPLKEKILGSSPSPGATKFTG